MIIYPAIDIKDNKCVRLYKGDYDKMTVYNENPVEVALEFQKKGAKFIHVVDLDGARGGLKNNRKLIIKIAKSVNIPIQTGGGIRSISDIEECIQNGINRVILGTSAINDPLFLKEAVDKFGDKIVVGIDAKDGYAAYSGWEKVSLKKSVEFALEIEKMGVKTIVYTDIATDGTLSGPNIPEMQKMKDSVKMDVIASGGVSNISDLHNLKKIGVSGAIVGKAIYTGNIDLAFAIKEIQNAD